MGIRSNAQVLAGLDFAAAKEAADPRDGLFFHKLARMRNAWVAYHAGAPWMARDADGLVVTAVAHESPGSLVWRDDADPRRFAIAEPPKGRVSYDRNDAAGILGQLAALLSEAAPGDGFRGAYGNGGDESCGDNHDSRYESNDAFEEAVIQALDRHVKPRVWICKDDENPPAELSDAALGDDGPDSEAARASRPLVVEVFLYSYGDGYGDGDVHGDGDGDGEGEGDNGDGEGDGYGDGFGFGFGYGDGQGDGRGYGYGYGYFQGSGE